jgi:hypothetical protein
MNLFPREQEGMASKWFIDRGFGGGHHFENKFSFLRIFKKRTIYEYELLSSKHIR